MVRVVVLYPHSPGKRFDFDYYMNRHIPLVQRLGEGQGISEIQVSKVKAGLGGGGQEYVCAATLAFDSEGSAQRYLASHGAEIFADIPNYTDIQPVIQMSEALL